MNVTTRVFPDPEGRLSLPVTEYTLTNDHGVSLSVINYGAIITDLRVPDREGRVESIVLRFPDLTGYIAHGDLYLGAMVGRVAGRIDGKPILLHGGGEFSTAFWEAEVFDLPDPSVCEQRQRVSVTFLYTSPAESHGFPGEVHAEVTYTLDNAGNVRIDFSAVSDKNTIYDPTNHTYFNLSGNGKRDVLSQLLIADADRVLELREDLIPTGRVLPVEGTAFDFRLGEPFARGRTSEHPQNLLVGRGYDHPFLFREEGNHSLRMSDPVSGRALTLTTDAPAFVMYTCNAPEKDIELADGPFVPFGGVALEAQGLPDAVHHPEWPSPVLPAGERFHRSTLWNFSIL